MEINPSEIQDFYVTVIKATEEEIVLRDNSGAEIRIFSSKILHIEPKLKYERIW